MIEVISVKVYFPGFVGFAVTVYRRLCLSGLKIYNVVNIHLLVSQVYSHPAYLSVLPLWRHLKSARAVSV